jgi:hypothetical protein
MRLTDAHRPLEPGQRVVFAEHETRWTGTIIKVKSAKASESPSYVVRRDDDVAWHEVGHVEIGRPPWTIAAGAMLASEKLSELQLDYQLEWLRKRSASAKPSGLSHLTRFQPLHPSYSQSPRISVQANALHEERKARASDDAKALKDALEGAYPGVKFRVANRNGLVDVAWKDGPARVEWMLEKFRRGPSNPDSQFLKISEKRSESDSLIESAIQFVQHVLGVGQTPKSVSLVDANLYRSGVLRSQFVQSRSMDLTYADLVRLVLIRWDDFQQEFDTKAAAGLLRQESDALFAAYQGDMSLASKLMLSFRENPSEKFPIDSDNHIKIGYSQGR